MKQAMKLITIEELNTIVSTFIASKMKAPRLNGINNKNENLAAFSLSIPWNNPAEMVIPLRLTPGNNANACIKPIFKLDLVSNFFSFFFMNFVRNKIVPVNKNAMAKKSGEVNNDSI